MASLVNTCKKYIKLSEYIYRRYKINCTQIISENRRGKYFLIYSLIQKTYKNIIRQLQANIFQEHRHKNSQ